MFKKEMVYVLLFCPLLAACTIGIVQRREVVDTPDATVLAALQTENAALATRVAIAERTASGTAVPDIAIEATRTQAAQSERADWAWRTYTTGDLRVAPSLLDRTGGGSPFTSDIAVAPSGVWVGSQYGVSHFDGTWTTYTYFDGSWVTYITDESMPASEVMSGVGAVAVTHDGTVWACGNNVSSFDGVRWTEYAVDNTLSEAHGLLSHTARAIAVGHDNTPWISTDLGLAHFDGQTWTSYPAPIYSTSDGPSPPILYDIAVAHDGSVWGAAWPDAYRFDGSAWTFYVAEGDDRLERSVDAIIVTNDGLEGTIDAHAVAVADDGTVWFGGGMGIASFDGTNWTSYDLPSGLHNVADIALAPDGTLWVGGHNGISHFDGYSWTTYTVADGLVNHLVQSIAIASDGAIWVGTESGLSYYGPSQ